MLRSCQNKLTQLTKTVSSRCCVVVAQVTGAVGWRTDNIKYKKNEVFLDIVEQVNMLMSSKGTVLRCDVNGKIVMKVFLSGMPDVKLGLNESLEVRACPTLPMPARFCLPHSPTASAQCIEYLVPLPCEEGAFMYSKSAGPE